MDKKQAIERFNNHLLKIQQPYMYEEDKQAVKMAILSMGKLEKIEQIIDDCDLEAWEVLKKIKEILEQE